MKNFFKHNLFTNPVDWAKKIVGKKHIFLLVVFSQVLFYTLMLYVIEGIGRIPSKIPIVVIILLIINMTMFPLMYLYALRSVFFEYKRLKDKIEE